MPPAAMWDPVSAACDGKAYVMGGRRGYGPTNAEVYAYDPKDDSWHPKAAMPQSVMCAGALSIGGRVYVFGGVHGDSESQRDASDLLQIYDLAKDSWETRKLPFKHFGTWAVAARPARVGVPPPGAEGRPLGSSRRRLSLRSRHGRVAGIPAGAARGDVPLQPPCHRRRAGLPDIPRRQRGLQPGCVEAPSARRERRGCRQPVFPAGDGRGVCPFAGCASTPPRRSA